MFSDTSFANVFGVSNSPSSAAGASAILLADSCCVSVSAAGTFGKSDVSFVIFLMASVSPTSFTVSAMLGALSGRACIILLKFQVRVSSLFNPVVYIEFLRYLSLFARTCEINNSFIQV